MTATNLRIAHISGQFSDSRVTHQRDDEAIFAWAVENGVDAITGTELRDKDALLTAAHAANYAVFPHKFGEWVAVNRRTLAVEAIGFEGPYVPAGRSGSARGGAHEPRGIVHLTATHKHADLGTLTFGVSHFLTQNDIRLDHQSNKPLLAGIGAFGKTFGSGPKVVFFNADANLADDALDVFSGEPFTTIADELRKHPATHGHDDIDLISSYDPDGRVKALSYRVLEDAAIHLGTDHYLLDAVYAIRPLPRAGQ